MNVSYSTTSATYVATTPDEPFVRAKPHRDSLSLNRYCEIVYWTTVLGVTEETLRAAVDSVGNSRDAVNVWLKYNR